MAKSPRAEELFAEEVLRRVLGIEVTQRDDGSCDRMVDALFEMPDGRQGALEVTTIGEREALELEAIAAKREWHVDGARWAWMVHVGRGVLMRELEHHLPTLIRLCERHGVTDPRRVPYRLHGQSTAFEWLDTAVWAPGRPACLASRATPKS